MACYVQPLLICVIVLLYQFQYSGCLSIAWDTIKNSSAAKLGFQTKETCKTGWCLPIKKTYTTCHTSLQFINQLHTSVLEGYTGMIPKTQQTGHHIKNRILHEL